MTEKTDLTIRIDLNEITYAALESAENEEDIYGPFDTVSNLMEALNV